MSLETINTQLKIHFEFTTIPLPTGQMVECVKQDAVLLPIAKVMVYAMGNIHVADDEIAELKSLKRLRREDQRAFAKSGKLNRLHELQRKQDNQRKSLENLDAFLKSGLLVSVEDIKQTISHLLEVGVGVTTSTSDGEMIRSQLNAPNGTLIVQTGWKVLDDGRRYMTTIHFLPAKY